MSRSFHAERTSGKTPGTKDSMACPGKSKEITSARLACEKGRGERCACRINHVEVPKGNSTMRYTVASGMFPVLNLWG